MKFGLQILILLFITPLVFAQSNDVAPLSLQQVLQITQKNNASVHASLYQELVTKRAINVAKANYFPTLDFQGIDSIGFPGSSPSLGVNGLMGSPYRTGLAEGLLAQQTLFDFGRTYYNVETAKKEATLSHQNTRVTSAQVLTLALQTYYDCSLYRTQRDTWKSLGQESNFIMKEAGHFVQTGQVSIEDKYLTQSQLEQANTAVEFFNERMKQSILELAIIMGAPPNTVMCPRLPVVVKAPLRDYGPDESPFMEVARASLAVSQSQLKKDAANYLPTFVGVASVGDMQQSRFVEKQDYAMGLGLNIPLFNWGTITRVKQDEAQIAFKEQNIVSQRVIVRENETKFDIVSESAKIRLRGLYTELATAQEGYKVAKQRYFNLQGTLVDLQEAYTDLARVQIEINQTRAEVLQASGSKALLDGAVPMPNPNQVQM